MAQTEEKFESWLKERLSDYNADEEVLVPYIKGILDTDETEEEQLEALEGIIAGMIEGDFKYLCRQIIDTWKRLKEDEETNAVSVPSIDVDKKLTELLDGSKISAAPSQSAKNLSSEQRKLKEAILSQYSKVSDGEEDDSEVDHTDSQEKVLAKNTNAEDVARAEKEQREKDKIEAQKKREKDKEDRARQKSRDDDRKDKEKKRTQKGERRR